MRVSVDKIAFNREMKRLDNLFREVSQRSFIAAKNSAEEYASTVKSGIGVTTPPSFAPHWKPLSEMWMAIKKDNKEKFWMETAGIYRAVGSKILLKTTRAIRVFGGIRRSTDSEAFNRAQKNEYGLGLGDARPLFEPAKDVVSQMTGAGRRLKSNLKFQRVVWSAIKKVYKR